MSGVQVDSGKHATLKCTDTSSMINCSVSEIGNATFACLIDTGSQVSLVHASLLTPSLLKKVKRKELILRTVDEKELSVSTCIDLCIQINGSSYKHEFLVMHELIHPIILGIDFICANSLKLEFSSPSNRPKCACSVDVENNDSMQLDEDIGLSSFEVETYSLPEVSDPDYKRLVHDYKEIFRVKPGRTNLYEYEIRLSDDVPIRIPPRRAPVHLTEEIQKLLQKLLDFNIIEPSKSPYVCPAVFVPKKSGGLRMTVDYRSLNKKSVSPATVLPHLDQVKEKLSGHSVFTVLDLNSGFFQIPLRQEDKEKTAFCPGPGFPVFQFTVLPQGISGGPAACTELMNRVYDNLPFTFNFMDDSMIISKSKEQHLSHLKKCFERIKQAGLTLNGAKCQIAKPEVEFLGTIFSCHGASPSPNKIAAILMIDRLSTVKEVRQFLGFASQYRKYIKNFAEIAEPLNRLLDKDAEFTWSDQSQAALDTLKARLSSAPVLANPDITKPFELYPDASDRAVGVVLMQENRPVEYASRALTSLERKYSVSEKECLAVLYALKVFRHYLLGRHFTLFTDHCPLTFLQTQKNDSHGRLGRWSLILQNFNFTIKYVKGSLNVSADALSRLCAKPSYSSCVAESSKVSLFSEGELKSAQLSDKNVKSVVMALKNGKLPNDALWKKEPLVYYRRIENKLLLDDSGLLCRRFRDVAGERCVPVIPFSLRQLVIKDCHEGNGCHLGPEKLYHTLKLSCYWPGMSSDIVDFCSACAICRERKPRGPLLAPLGSMPIGKPWEFVATDILKVPMSAEGHQYILTFQDYFTKFLYATPIKDQSAETVTRELVKVFSIFGAPAVLHSDQGGCYESQLFKEALTGLRIMKSHTSAYNPKCNGMVERSNRSILQLLRCLCDEAHDWEKKLPFALMAFNSHVHITTGMTPSRLMFARDSLSNPSFSTASSNRYYDINSYAKQLEAEYVKTHEFVHDRLEQMAGIAKKRYDRRAFERPSLQPGEEVLLKNETRRSKLDPYWIRGWVVVKAKGLLVTIKRRGVSGGHKVVNINRVKSADDVRGALVRDDLGFRVSEISHSVMGADEDGISEQSRDATDESGMVRRYPLRNRRPPERLTYDSF